MKMAEPETRSVNSTLSLQASNFSVPMALLLMCLLATVAVKVCRKRMGIGSSQPTWFVFERLFPRAFPRVVGFVWACIGLIPVEFLIWLHGCLMHWSRKSVFSFRRMPGAEGMVALTIDDAIARGIDSQMMHEVLEILAEYNAKCSFFIVTSFVDRFDALLREAVKNGHEICNHGGEDIPYHRHSKEEFRKILLECEEKIDTCLREVNATSPHEKGQVNRRNNKWFRPPHAKMSDHMVEVLDEEGFRIAMCDCYGMDVMCRPPFIANYTVSHAHPGSILLLHMPEVAFREYNLQSLRMVLAGLRARGLQCVSLSQLEQACLSHVDKPRDLARGSTAREREVSPQCSPEPPPQKTKRP